MPQIKKPIKKSKDTNKKESKSGIRGKRKILFICTNNLIRSKTAEDILLKNKNYEVKSAGLSPWADVPVSSQAIKWADIIFVMDEENESQKSRLLQRFPEAWKKKVIILEIPSRNVQRNDPEMEKLIKEKLKIHLK